MRTGAGQPEKGFLPRAALELAGIILGGCAIFLLSARHDWMERLLRFTKQHEEWQIDEVFTVTVFLATALGWFAFLRWREAVFAWRRLERKNADLEQALAEVQKLEGIIPICAACKRVRDDQGYWHQVEQYIRERSEAEFSHGLCPECTERLYPGLGLRKQQQTPGA